MLEAQSTKGLSVCFTALYNLFFYVSEKITKWNGGY